MEKRLVCLKCQGSMFNFIELESGIQLFVCVGCGCEVRPTYRVEFDNKLAPQEAIGGNLPAWAHKERLLAGLPQSIKDHPKWREYVSAGEYLVGDPGYWSNFKCACEVERDFDLYSERDFDLTVSTERH